MFMNFSDYDLSEIQYFVNSWIEKNDSRMMNNGDKIDLITAIMGLDTLRDELEDDQPLFSKDEHIRMIYEVLAILISMQTAVDKKMEERSKKEETNT